MQLSAHSTTWKSDTCLTCEPLPTLYHHQSLFHHDCIRHETYHQRLSLLDHLNLVNMPAAVTRRTTSRCFWAPTMAIISFCVAVRDRWRYQQRRIGVQLTAYLRFSPPDTTRAELEKYDSVKRLLRLFMATKRKRQTAKEAHHTDDTLKYLAVTIHCFLSTTNLPIFFSDSCVSTLFACRNVVGLFGLGVPLRVVMFSKTASFFQRFLQFS